MTPRDPKGEGDADAERVEADGGTALGISIGSAGAAAAGEKVARWEKGCGLSEPKVVEKAPPAYPEAARAEKVQGVVCSR